MCQAHPTFTPLQTTPQTACTYAQTGAGEAADDMLDMDNTMRSMPQNLPCPIGMVQADGTDA